MQFLDNALWNKTTLKVLQLFVSKPTSKTYLAQIVKDSKLSKVSAIKALSKLQTEKILKFEYVGKTKLYWLDNQNPIVREFKKLFSLSYLMRKLKLFENCEIYLFGSAARGENDEKSDYDLLILSDDLNEIRSNLHFLDDEKIKPILMSNFEYSSLYRNDKPFYERIEKDKIRVI